MDMQTGPAPKQSMDNWLLWTGSLEIFNVLVFTFLWWTLNTIIPSTQDLLSLLGLLTLNLVLLEGGLYWLLARARFFKKTPARVRLPLLQGVYAANVLALLVFPVAALLRAGPTFDWGDFWLGAGFYLFGFGEFLHYFIFKINMRPNERERTGSIFVPARLLRELRRARAE